MSEAVLTDQESKFTVEVLKGMKVKEVMALFKTLPAPTFDDMQGEFDGFLLDHGDPITNFVSVLSISNPLTTGRWKGKAFTFADKVYGHGYNLFEKFGKTKRKIRMRTQIVESRFDGKPAFILDYTAYDSFLGKVNTVDEIRKLDDDLYLGVGTWGFTKKQRMKPFPFCLKGPLRSFVGVD